MITERMLELSCFNEIFKHANENAEYATFLANEYNVKKMLKRYNELGKEFLEPYTKDNTR